MEGVRFPMQNVFHYIENGFKNAEDKKKIRRVVKMLERRISVVLVILNLQALLLREFSVANYLESLL